MKNAPNNFVLNSLRTLLMLENALKRLVRQNFVNPCQAPENLKTILDTIAELRARILSYKHFGNVPTYMALVIASIEDLSRLVSELIATCPYGKGKKRKSNRTKESEVNNLSLLICSDFKKNA
jgi:hypothetical protein